MYLFYFVFTLVDIVVQNSVHYAVERYNQTRSISIYVSIVIGQSKQTIETSNSYCRICMYYYLRIWTVFFCYYFSNFMLQAIPSDIQTWLQLSLNILSPLFTNIIRRSSRVYAIQIIYHRYNTILFVLFCSSLPYIGFV